MLLFSGSHVSQIGSGTEPEAIGKPLAKTVDEIINHPTPASRPASSEFHRPQPLGQPVRFSKQEKLKVDPPHKKV